MFQYLIYYKAKINLKKIIEDITYIEEQMNKLKNIYSNAIEINDSITYNKKINDFTYELSEQKEKLKNQVLREIEKKLRG